VLDLVVAMASGDPALDQPAWASFGDYLDATDAVQPAANISAGRVPRHG
jgi:N-acyl-D-aspartate/D-glutamate deacylase